MKEIFIDNNFSSLYRLFPLFAIAALAINALILVFSGLITLTTPETNLKNRVHFLFVNLSFKFGIIFSLALLVFLVILLISIISGKNAIKRWLKFKFFNIQYFYYILLMSLIDIFLYLVIYR